MAELKFFKCDGCGDVVVKLFEAGDACTCPEGWTEIEANTVDAATEKHVPVISVEGNLVTVEVGEVEHPMADEHFITFICLQTTAGAQCAQLKPGMAPVATFALADGAQAVAAYEYCNLHGLWKAEA